MAMPNGYEELTAQRDTIEEQLIHHKKMVDHLERQRQTVHDAILRLITHQEA